MEGGYRSDLTDHQGPQCKACSAFKSWAKAQGEASKVAENTTIDNECPLDKDELGRSTWGFLHTMAAYYPCRPCDKDKTKMLEFIKAFAELYPCNVCALHFQEDLKKSPPDVSSNYDLSQWFCRMHNLVNVRLGKPEFDCKRVLERWKDGWKDGSCD